MKTFIFALVTGLLPALMLTNGAAAQNSVNTEIFEPNKHAGSMEKNDVQNGNTVNMGAISTRAMKDFSRSYKNVTGDWSKTDEGFAAKFNTDGVRSIIYYSNNGLWTGSLKGYMEDKMPADVRRIVKREYYDYTITYVQEVQTIGSEGVPTYIINLEDKNSIKLVRVHDGEMDIYKEYKKQS